MSLVKKQIIPMSGSWNVTFAYKDGDTDTFPLIAWALYEDDSMDGVLCTSEGPATVSELWSECALSDETMPDYVEYKNLTLSSA